MAIAISEHAKERSDNESEIWHRSAPRQLVEKFGANLTAGWTIWQKHLAGRKRQTAPPMVLANWPELAGSDGNAWESVAAAYALPELAKTMESEHWWDLVERLRDLAVQAQQWHISSQSDPHDVLRQQLLAGELPLALGYLFPELSSLRTLRETAREAFSEAIVELTDGQGLPHGRLWPVFLPMFACWTRARWMGQRLKRGCWSREAEIQYQWLLRQAIRLTGPDGRLMLGDAGELPEGRTRWPRDLYATALELVGDKWDCAAAHSALPRHVVPPRASFDKDDLPDVSLESEWAGVAVLATDWKRSAVRVAVSYVDEAMRFEAAVGRERLLAGLLTSQTKCNGETVQAIGEWEQVCWQTDRKCDYLELSVALSHGLRLERQLLLSRDDRVLYLADAVLANDGDERRIGHTIELPLGPGAQWRPEQETRDGVLIAGKERAAVLPLALAEWRCDPRGGRIELAEGKLTLTQETVGRRLYCPLLFDFDRKRTKQERTWRQLTVAESLAVVTRDVAVGFRGQSGSRQWLFYRSLAAAGNRTVIGQNIAGEFYAGRLRTSGKMDEWIEIDANDEMTNDE